MYEYHTSKGFITYFLHISSSLVRQDPFSPYFFFLYSHLLLLICSSPVSFTVLSRASNIPSCKYYFPYHSQKSVLSAGYIHRRGYCSLCRAICWYIHSSMLLPFIPHIKIITFFENVKQKGDWLSKSMYFQPPKSNSNVIQVQKATSRITQRKIKSLSFCL